MFWHQRVDFTYILLTAFTCADHQSAKRHWQLDCLFAPLGICASISSSSKCWWNWPQVSISSTFYKPIFLQTSFLCLEFGFEQTFIRKIHEENVDEIDHRFKFRDRRLLLTLWPLKICDWSMWWCRCRRSRRRSKSDRMRLDHFQSRSSGSFRRWSKRRTWKPLQGLRCPWKVSSEWSDFLSHSAKTSNQTKIPMRNGFS